MTSTTQSRTAAFFGRDMLNKVPEITVYFWVIKILARPSARPPPTT